MADHDNLRVIEDSIERDLREKLDYGGYLRLDQLLSAQHPVSSPPHHDELLFIVQHQVAELWMRLVIHELKAAVALIVEDRVGQALKVLARVKQIQRQLFEQWSVLETLTPSEYLQFRHLLGPASGFQSFQYRTIEFLLGNKNAGMIAVFAHDPERQALLREVLESPSLYDEFLRWLARHGHDVPPECIERDWSQPYRRHAGLLPVYRRIYENPDDHWEAYNIAEKLVDVEEGFQLWRFRHMKTVERIIGFRRGTGGSSGVAFLKRALDLTFFPELFEVRTHLGSDASD
ncbi:tryptophan 2,3-dioxygenase [Pseudofulvimonas gallinarii]|uniref:Tryptophan 2,3-dioxygenase n=1 Tax=Pseudofulvimonas gallinarii TaxID=634155 RepID=A0A4S3KXH5_9GAMM|nr:tryptophan 2,3-dioxygenase [Pseudofulvimonas gallinarii]TCS99168.1 tryptophan 2,3-dioxygenase [Pseudofulvimonas gallinarii]THD14037.1 tryptophan 2,3-dioxygenase [Pseudofulvimonas gallinarii]